MRFKQFKKITLETRLFQEQNINKLSKNSIKILIEFWESINIVLCLFFSDTEKIISIKFNHQQKSI